MTPNKITPNTNTENYLLGWSRDGHYLAYEADHMDGKALFLWDGKTSRSIYQHKSHIGELDWSADGRLAFTEFYTFVYSTDQPPQDPPEIQIWDGTTVDSLSQNSTGEDRRPTWSTDGKLAFLSERDGAYDIFIWDGRSTVDGFADGHTFTNVAPDLTSYFSSPVWTDSGTLSFVGYGPGDQHAQIYEWDGQKAVNISQNAGLHNGGQSWRGDGTWAFVTYFSPEQLLYVRDSNNQTVLTTAGEYPPAWSENGRLMFCVPDSAGRWGLAIWDGSAVVEIANDYEIEAFWSNGAGVLCSSG